MIKALKTQHQTEILKCQYNLDMLSLQEENSKLKHDLEGLPEENSKLKHDVEDLREEINRLILVAGGLQEENSKLKHFVEGLQTKNRTLKHITRAENSYTKLKGQKGIAIIVYRKEDNSTDLKVPVEPHLQDFFQEMGFVVKYIEDSYLELSKGEIPDGHFYCAFLVLLTGVDYDDTEVLQSKLRNQATPMIVVIAGSCHGCICFYDLHEEPDTLTVSSFHPSRGSYRNPDIKPENNNMLDDFMEVTRCNRFADIMDIFTRMNELYDQPVVTVRSTLRKKFCFL